MKVILLCLLWHGVATQDDRLIDVRQIMKDAFDIIRNAPPPPELTQMGKMILPAVQQRPLPLPAYQYQTPVLNNEQIQVLRKIQAKMPLTGSELNQAKQLQRFLQYQAEMRAHTQQPGQYPYAYYQQQASPVIPMINRIFATPTENDIERLVRLPADILYKMASEGKYIEPEQSDETKITSKTKIPPTTEEKDEKKDNLFGDFNFNIQGDGPGGNPFLTATTKTAEESEAKHVENQTKVNNDNQTIPEHVKDNHQKPYFYYAKDKQGDDMGKWVLVVPPTENNEPPKISVAELVELSKSLVKASQRAGMNDNISNFMFAGLNQSTSQLPSSTPSTPPPTSPFLQQSLPQKPTLLTAEKKPEESKLPIASFVQEGEFENQEKEKQLAELSAHEIVLDGKRYKLVRENDIERGDNVKPVQQAVPTIQQAVPMVQPLQPVIPAFVEQKPASNVPITKSDVRAYLTPEQEAILFELQKRIVQQQQQPQIVQNPPQQSFQQTQFIPKNNEAVVKQLPPSIMKTFSETYYEKIPQNVVKIPATPGSVYSSSQVQISNPVQIVNPAAPAIPMRRQYSLQELEEYYQSLKLPNREPSPSLTVIDPSLKNPEKVYAPHKQIKIQMGNNSKKELDENVNAETTHLVVDSPAVAAHKERQRIADLRRQFALERQQLFQRGKSKLQRTTVLDATTSAPNIVTEQHCYNIRSFARQSGAKNVVDYAFSHCHYIENYYPDLKCENVNDYMAICKQYYITRRMLFAH